MAEELRIHKTLEKLFAKHSLTFNNFTEELESKEYKACQFTVDKGIVICRTAKITPTKIGAFVTFWKRNRPSAPIQPFEETDVFSWYVVVVESKNNSGFFVFPKSVLINRGILSTKTKEGKRGFRVYAPWDVPSNKQAVATQKWQIPHFYNFNNTSNVLIIKRLFGCHFHM